MTPQMSHLQIQKPRNDAVRERRRRKLVRRRTGRGRKRRTGGDGGRDRGQLGGTTMRRTGRMYERLKKARTGIQAMSETNGTVAAPRRQQRVQNNGHLLAKLIWMRTSGLRHQPLLILSLPLVHLLPPQVPWLHLQFLLPLSRLQPLNPHPLPTMIRMTKLGHNLSIKLLPPRESTNVNMVEPFFEVKVARWLPSSSTVPTCVSHVVEKLVSLRMRLRSLRMLDTL